MKTYKGKVYRLNPDSVTTLAELVAQCMDCSKSEAKRLIKSGGVRINQIQCKDIRKIFQITDELKEYCFNIGKFDDNFILLLDHDQEMPSEEIVLLNWQKFMKSNPVLTRELVLSWSFWEYST